MGGHTSGHASGHTNGHTVAGELAYADYLLDAYSVFQRLEIAVELLLAEAVVDNSPHSSMWSHLRREMKKIIQNVYTEVVREGMQPPAPLARRVISQDIRCMQHSVYRDIRDFIVFRSIKNATSFYYKIFQRK